MEEDRVGDLLDPKKMPDEVMNSLPTLKCPQRYPKSLYDLRSLKEKKMLKGQFIKGQFKK